MQPIRLYLLGPPRVERDGQTLVMDTRKATALLAYLVLTSEPLSRDVLAAFLWPDFDDGRARAALRRTLSTLKTAVGPDILFATRDVIGIEPDRVWCDVGAFTDLLTETSDAVALATAVTLYRGSFMHGFSLRDSLPFDDWQLLQAQQFGRQFESALEQLTGLFMAQQLYEQALTHVLRRIAHDPLREEGHRLAMELYARLGQRSAALRQYRDCVRILDEDLGVPPLEATTRLYHAIQEGEFIPQPPAPVSPVAETALPMAGSLPLVGRDAELAELWASYGAVGPDGRLLALTGEAGIGKTRLAATFAAQLQAQGVSVLQATCYEGEMTLAYQPFEQALRGGLAQPDADSRLRQLAPELLTSARLLVPELVDVDPAAVVPSALDEAAARSRFFTAVTHTITALCTGERPGVLLIDDAHWTDEASLELLAFVARRLRARPVHLLVTWRDDEERASTLRLQQMLAAVRRDGMGAQIKLPRLRDADIAQLVAAANLDSAPDLAQRLSREAEGLPFVAVEYLTMFVQQKPPAAPGVWDMPLGVRDLLEARLLAASDIGGQLLQVAAVIGRAFDYELLLEAGGRSEEETVSVLEELAHKGLIREQAKAVSQPGYDFSHDKLRALVLEQTSLGRQRLLHRRLAEAFVARARRAAQPAVLAAQIANHYRLAGQDATAVDYFQQAGDHARSLHAHQEALTHYQTALALGARDPAVLHAACGDLYTLQGRYAAALTSYETAAAMAEPDALGALELKLGQVYLRQGEWALAEQQFARARARFGKTAPADWLARLEADWSLAAHRQGHDAQAAERAQVAFELAQTAGETAVLAQCVNMLGILARGRSELVTAVNHLSRSLELARQSDRVDLEIAALNNLALVQGEAGQLDKARQGVEHALVLCQTLGDRHREAALRSNLADLLHQAGDEEAAREQVRQSVTIYAEIGREQGIWQSGIWRLTEW